KLVVMHETSSSIDGDNEYELHNAFQYFMKEKTVIMIAQRLSSIKSVDEILVLSEGKIEECGNHNELMSKQRVYKELVT
ncbi:ABC transporter ATP-binding protein, partial [Enterococcus faecalis]